MLRKLSIVLFILFSLSLTFSALAQKPIATAGMWQQMQCDQVYSASLEYLDDTRSIDLDTALLMTMVYEVGIWADGSPIPFGRTFSHNDMIAVVWLNTPCSDDLMLTRVYENQEGDYTVIVFRDLLATYADTDEPCRFIAGQPNPRRCGLHHGIFGYVSHNEWQRVTSVVKPLWIKR